MSGSRTTASLCLLAALSLLPPLIGCSDDDSPTAPPTGWVGEESYAISTQAELDELAGVTVISGSLTMISSDDDPIVDLSPLADLVAVGDLLLQEAAVTDLRGLRSLVHGNGEVRIRDCDQLTSLAGLENLARTHRIWLTNCPELADISALAAARPASLVLTDLPALTTAAGVASADQDLASLTIMSCPRLTALPGDDLAALEQLLLRDLPALPAAPLPARLPAVRTVDLDDLPGLEDLTGLEDAGNLESVHLARLPAVTHVPDLHGANRLRELVLEDLPGVTDLSPVGGLAVRTLRLDQLGGVTDLSGLTDLDQLTELVIGGCQQFTSLAGLVAPGRLEALTLLDCPQLTTVGTASLPTAVRQLQIRGCGFADLAGFALPAGCEVVTIRACDQLTALDGLTLPEAIGSLTIADNPVLTSLDGVTGLASLGRLIITGNTALGDAVAEAFAAGLEVTGLQVIEGNGP
jgi:hypothetical protein